MAKSSFAPIPSRKMLFFERRTRDFLNADVGMVIHTLRTNHMDGLLVGVVPQYTSGINAPIATLGIQPGNVLVELLSFGMAPPA